MSVSRDTYVIKKHSRKDVVQMMDALVWEPQQNKLAKIMGVEKKDWSSLLTVETPPNIV